jgi:hypothetical protein
VNKRQRLKQLAWREYLPLGLTIALWAVIVAAIGHADAARLLATTTAVRAVQLLTKLATPSALIRRAEAPSEIRRQARRFAFTIQAGGLVAGLVLVVLLVEAMKAIGQHQIAHFLPFVALGMPARYFRLADLRTASPYYRLALAGSGLTVALFGWVAGWYVAALGLAFGAREWMAYAAFRWWPASPAPVHVKIAEPLRFSEVARNSAIYGRQLLTYRLSKALLTLFGPFGNVAARTGRGLNWHRKVEPYVPHHLGGFILFAAATLGGAAFLALRSGEPAAMVLAAGLLQIGAASANILIFWRYLPRDGDVALDDDYDD